LEVERSFKQSQNKLPTAKFSNTVFLQKVLSRVRVLTLKTDHKTSYWLQQLRESSQKNKFGDKGEYWKKVKRATKKATKKNRKS